MAAASQATGASGISLARGCRHARAAHAGTAPGARDRAPRRRRTPISASNRVLAPGSTTGAGHRDREPVEIGDPVRRVPSLVYACEPASTFRAPEPPDPGYDWVDDLGRTYDAMGDGTKARFLQMQDFLESITHHLRKGNTFTVIDVTGFSAEQVTAIRAFVDKLADPSIIRVGF